MEEASKEHKDLMGKLDQLYYDKPNEIQEDIKEFLNDYGHEINESKANYLIGFLRGIETVYFLNHKREISREIIKHLQRSEESSIFIWNLFNILLNDHEIPTDTSFKNFIENLADDYESLELEGDQLKLVLEGSR